MCGIYFRAGRHRSLAPDWLDAQTQCKHGSGPGSRGTLSAAELGPNEISTVVRQDLERETVLSSRDLAKIKNLKQLRRLQIALQEHRSAKDAKGVAEVEAQVRQLMGEENPSSSQLNTDVVPTSSTGSGGSGICSSVATKLDDATLVDRLGSSLAKILARGPDYAQYIEFEQDGCHFQLMSSVLSLRQPFTKQPLCDCELVLQFNGELYSDGCLDSNDTQFVMDTLKGSLKSASDREAAIQSAVTSLDGEFAFVLTDTSAHKVYFGKDSVGKRSLTYKLGPASLAIASIPTVDDVGIVECKGNHLYVFDLDTFLVKTIQLSEHPLVPSKCTSGPEKLDFHLGELHRLLKNSCKKRQITIRPLSIDSSGPSLAILFSGGLDCTTLAALIAENFIEDKKEALIDLLSVGFENPRTHLSAAESPDRKLSEQSWFELCESFSKTNVRFRLVHIDVSYSQWLRHRRRVLNLIRPCATEMDLSIAIAFYFATRASECEAVELDPGFFCDASNHDNQWEKFRHEKDRYTRKLSGYTSPAKVLFSGLGADELFGGYSRHENIFNGLSEDSSAQSVVEKYEELSTALLHDIDVIYERNLGRDDRAMSSWGKELRYPFLDQELIEWVTERVQPNLKVKFEWINQRTKKGEKRVMKFERKYLLRQLASSVLGLKLVSRELKRAIQFGAKSAKMEIGQSKTKGTDVLCS